MERMKMLVSVPKFGALVVVAFALSTALTGKAIAASNTPPDGPVDDAQIVHRVLEFDRGEVQTADAVKGRLASAIFWQFAQRMSADHATVDEKFRSLTAGSRQSGDDRHGADIDLQKLTGDDLEKAYVDREIQSHEAMLAVLERELIPNAMNGDLRRELMGLLTQVKAHLAHAGYVQGFLPQSQAQFNNSAG